MPLHTQKRRGKDYLYITLNGSKKLYLGTIKKPRLLPLVSAIKYLDGRIAKYNEEREKPARLLEIARKGAAGEIEAHRIAIKELKELL